MWELEKAVKECKDGKSPGVDDLIEEMFKVARPMGMQWLCKCVMW